MTVARKDSRVAFVSAMSGFPWGGSEILWSRAAEYLRRSENEVTAFVHDWGELPSPLQALKDTGATIHQLRAPRLSFLERQLLKVRKRLSLPVRDLSEFASGVSTLERLKPDVVCISHGGTTCGWRWMEWCLRKGIPYFSISQANSEWAWPNDDFAEKLREVHLGAVRTLFVSQGNLELFEHQIGSRLPNSQVVRNPVQVRLESLPSWPPMPLSLACVGRLETAAKGQDLILRVLAQPQWHNREIRVTFYGTGPNKDTLPRLAKLLGVQDRVDFAGHVRDVEAIWGKHHAMILASRYEGLPLAVVEAMLCRRLAIVTDVAGNAEIINDGVNGFVAEAPTAKHLNDAMERAWLARQEWELMGERGRQAALVRYETPPEHEVARMLLEVR